MTEFLDFLASSPDALALAKRRFEKYCALLQEKNKVMNLTAITVTEDIYLKHFADSVLGLPFVRGSVLDVGAGAGFPSLPLKIARPELTVTMADSLNKRVLFLREVIEALGLEGIRALHCRAEDLPKNEKYDTVVARAVAPLSTLCELCLPFVKMGGMFVAYKSDKAGEELSEAKKAIRLLGGELFKVDTFPLYQSGILRSFVQIKKIAPTPAGYPRSGNKPKTAPICG